MFTKIISTHNAITNKMNGFASIQKFVIKDKFENEFKPVSDFLGLSDRGHLEIVDCCGWQESTLFDSVRGTLMGFSQLNKIKPKLNCFSSVDIRKDVMRSLIDNRFYRCPVESTERTVDYLEAWGDKEYGDVEGFVSLRSGYCDPEHYKDGIQSYIAYHKDGGKENHGLDGDWLSLQMIAELLRIHIAQIEVDEDGDVTEFVLSPSDAEGNPNLNTIVLILKDNRYFGTLNRREFGGPAPSMAKPCRGRYFTAVPDTISDEF